MSVSSDVILILPASDIIKATPRTLINLTKILNDGFAQAHRHNLLTGDRVSDPKYFVRDFGFAKESEKCVLYLYVAAEALDDPQLSKYFKKLEVPDVDTKYYLVDSTQQLDCIFPQDLVKSTIGYKPFEGDDIYEMTAYTSFAKGAGPKIFNLTVPRVKQVLACRQVIAQCFVPHNLVGYYEKKLGFTELYRIKYKKDDTPFPDTLKFTKDFEYSSLGKYI